MHVNEAVHDPQIYFTNPYLRTLRLENKNHRQLLKFKREDSISTTQDVQGHIQLLGRRIRKAL